MKRQKKNLNEAGVTITQTLNNNGIIAKAKSVETTYKESVDSESEQLNSLSKQFEELSKDRKS